MKRLQHNIFLACMIFVIETYAEEYQKQPLIIDNENSTMQETITKPLSENAIPFITQEEDYPIGEYCPASHNGIIHPDGNHPINSASAYIGDDSYSEVTEEKYILPHQEAHYLGYFINREEEIIHLYGIKDQISPNDASQETIIDEDLIDDDIDDQ